MIPEFEKYTQPLTSYEKAELTPRIFRGLIKAYFNNKKISNKQMREILKKEGYKITGARVRKIIQYLRTKEKFELKNGLRLVILGGQEGYWLSSDIDEIKNWVNSAKKRVYAQTYGFMCVEKDLKKIEKFYANIHN